MVLKNSIDDNFIHQVNEVYHDVESELYSDRHDDIFDDIGNYWEITCKKIFDKKQSGRTILDFGTGTGMTPLQISRYLTVNDNLICADASEKMLAVCKWNLERKNLPCSMKFIKLPKDIETEKPILSDVILINAVLHHIPDPDKLLKILVRWLNPGGVMVIGHEPNRSFSQTGMLWYSYRIGSVFFNPKLFFYELLILLGLFENLRRPLGKLNSDIAEYNQIIEEVNRRLMVKGVVKKPMRGQDVIAIVDIHSATAGGFHRGRGIDLDALKESSLKGLQTVFFDSYMHLGKIYPKGKIGRWLENFLRSKYPERGSKFFAVLKKPKIF